MRLVRMVSVPARNWIQSNPNHHQPEQKMKLQAMIILPGKNSICRSHLWRRFLLILLLLGLSFVLLPAARAQLSPPPDGGYPGNNTAEGDGALFNFDSAAKFPALDNTAVGFQALYLLYLAGNDNTAIGSGALYSNTGDAITRQSVIEALFTNTTGIDNTATGSAALLTTPLAPEHGHRISCARQATQPATTTRPPVLVRS